MQRLQQLTIVALQSSFGLVPLMEDSTGIILTAFGTRGGSRNACQGIPNGATVDRNSDRRSPSASPVGKKAEE